MQDDRYTEAARREWSQVRRKALWSQLQSIFSSKNIGMVDFKEVSERLNLGPTAYRGVQPIPLARIVGSTGRYQDFVQAFLPVNEEMGDRWQNIARMYLDPSRRGWSPIEVYQVGNSYFVVDGNHRVSVAHQLKLSTIDAHVWEFLEPVPGVGADVDMDTLLLAAERHSFLQQTRLDELRPGHTIRLTVPRGYAVLLDQIARHQQAINWIDGVEMAYEEAVTSWYDLVYSNIVLLIEESGVLDNFPNRTGADFFIWVLQEHRRLDERYGSPVVMTEPGRWRRPWRRLQRWLRR